MHKYKKIKQIGTGSFGSAILAQNKLTNELVAIKRINVATMSEKEKKDAINEAQVLKRLEHPNIIACHENFISDDGFLNIVMDYADGGDLYQCIQNAKAHFPEEQIMHWFIQIVSALKHVHDNNVLHRDLKTQNIFLTKQNIVKLGDFGIARVLNSQTEMAKTVIGTPYYLSPELCEDKPYNKKSDVWSLGCVLYELSTLKHAFDGQNFAALVLKILRGRYPPVPSHYSDNLKFLVESMLQKDPDLRPDIDEILSLEFIQGGMEAFIADRGKKAPSPGRALAISTPRGLVTSSSEDGGASKPVAPPQTPSIPTSASKQAAPSPTPANMAKQKPGMNTWIAQKHEQMKLMSEQLRTPQREKAAQPSLAVGGRVRATPGLPPKPQTSESENNGSNQQKRQPQPIGGRPSPATKPAAANSNKRAVTVQSSSRAIGGVVSTPPVRGLILGQQVELSVDGDGDCGDDGDLDSLLDRIESEPCKVGPGMDTNFDYEIKQVIREAREVLPQKGSKKNKLELSALIQGGDPDLKKKHDLIVKEKEARRAQLSKQAAAKEAESKQRAEQRRAEAEQRALMEQQLAEERAKKIAEAEERKKQKEREREQKREEMRRHELAFKGNLKAAQSRISVKASVQISADQSDPDSQSSSPQPEPSPITPRSIQPPTPTPPPPTVINHPAVEISVARAVKVGGRQSPLVSETPVAVQRRAAAVVASSSSGMSTPRGLISTEENQPQPQSKSENNREFSLAAFAPPLRNLKQKSVATPSPPAVDISPPKPSRSSPVKRARAETEKKKPVGSRIEPRPISENEDTPQTTKPNKQPPQTDWKKLKREMKEKAAAAAAASDFVVEIVLPKNVNKSEIKNENENNEIPQVRSSFPEVQILVAVPHQHRSIQIKSQQPEPESSTSQAPETYSVEHEIPEPEPETQQPEPEVENFKNQVREENDEIVGRRISYSAAFDRNENENENLGAPEEADTENAPQSNVVVVGLPSFETLMQKSIRRLESGTFDNEDMAQGPLVYVGGDGSDADSEFDSESNGELTPSKGMLSPLSDDSSNSAALKQEDRETLEEKDEQDLKGVLSQLQTVLLTASPGGHKERTSSLKSPLSARSESKLKDPTKEERLSSRIEALKIDCEKRLGADIFVELYKHLKEDDDDEVIRNILGERLEELQPHVQFVYQLIHCEELFYGTQSSA